MSNKPQPLSQPPSLRVPIYADIRTTPEQRKQALAILNSSIQKMTDAEQVILIHSYHPELAITQAKSGNWEWSFRCITSEDLEGAEDGFWSPLAALAHYARWVSDQADLMMEIGNEEEE